MNNFFDHVWLGNSIKEYMLIGFIILLAFLIKRLISKNLALALFNFFAPGHRPYLKQSFLDTIIKPLQWFVFYFIALVAFDQLSFPEDFTLMLYKTDVRKVLHALGNLFLIFFFIRLCIKFNLFMALVLEAKASHTNGSADTQLIVFFKDFFKVLLIILGILLIIKYVFNQPLSGLFTGLSIMGAAIALGTRESLENLIASFVIFFDKPFITGDIIKIKEYTGTVEKIGLRSTRIRTDHKNYISVPNKQMVDNIIDNLSMRTQKKTEIRMELDLKTNAENILQLKQNVIEMLSTQTAINSFTVFITDSGKQAHILAVDYYVGSDMAAIEESTLKERNIIQILKFIEQQSIKLQNEKPNIRFSV